MSLDDIVRSAEAKGFKLDHINYVQGSWHVAFSLDGRVMDSGLGMTVTEAAETALLMAEASVKHNNGESHETADLV